jgi:hypothetical protein
MWKLSGNMGCAAHSGGSVSTVFFVGVYGFLAWRWNYESTITYYLLGGLGGTGLCTATIVAR